MDLLAADCSLQRALRGVLPPQGEGGSVHALGSMGSFVTEHALVLLWRLRFHRLQALLGCRRSGALRRARGR